MSKTPAAKWAQRPDKIFLTIDVPNLYPAQTKARNRTQDSLMSMRLVGSGNRALQADWNMPVPGPGDQDSHCTMYCAVSALILWLHDQVDIKEDSFSFASGDFVLKFEFCGKVGPQDGKLCPASLRRIFLRGYITLACVRCRM